MTTYYDFISTIIQRSLTYFNDRALFVPQNVLYLDFLIYLFLSLFIVGAIIKVIVMLNSRYIYQNKKFLTTKFGISIIFNMIGLSLVVISELFSTLALIISNSQFTILWEDKNWLLMLGGAMFYSTFPYIIFSIISPTDLFRKILQPIAIVNVMILFIAFIVILLVIGDYVATYPILLAIFLSFTLILVTFLSIITLYSESRITYDTRNKKRIYILLLGITCYALESNLITFIYMLFIQPPVLQILEPIFLTTDYNSVIITFTFIIAPLLRLILYPVIILSLYYGNFFPLWLQERLHVLPPSFTELKMKREQLKTQNMES